MPNTNPDLSAIVFHYGQVSLVTIQRPGIVAAWLVHSREQLREAKAEFGELFSFRAKALPKNSPLPIEKLRYPVAMQFMRALLTLQFTHQAVQQPHFKLPYICWDAQDAATGMKAAVVYAYDEHSCFAAVAFSVEQLRQLGRRLFGELGRAFAEDVQSTAKLPVSQASRPVFLVTDRRLVTALIQGGILSGDIVPPTDI